VALDLYSRLDLQPFHGLIQWAVGDGLRALSLDGEHWRLQLRAPAQPRPWGALDQTPSEPRWHDLGDWSPTQGLQLRGLAPELAKLQRQGQAEALVAELAARLDQLPFPRRDLHELWLCDDQGEPLALLASGDSAEQLPTRPLFWRPLYEAPGEGEERAGLLSPEAVAGLTDAVRSRARRRLCRALQRAGAALVDAEGGVVSAPELPLCESWPTEPIARQVAHYHAWHAPWLLQLHHLSATTRARLEQAACQRPWLVAALHRTWPVIIDAERITAARVEARLREGVESL